MAGEILSIATPEIDIKTAAVVIGAASAAGLGGLLSKPYVRVPQGFEGVRVRGGIPSTYHWGKNKGKVKTMAVGKHASIPFSHDIRLIDTRHQTTDLDTTPVDRPEGQFVVDASVFWRVMPSGVERRYFIRRKRGSWRNQQENDYPARSIHEVADLERAVKSLGGNALREAIETAPESEFRNSSYIGERVKEKCDPLLLMYGVEVLGIGMDQASEAPPDRYAKTLGSILAKLPPDTPDLTTVVTSSTVSHTEAFLGLHSVPTGSDIEGGESA